MLPGNHFNYCLVLAFGKTFYEIKEQLRGLGILTSLGGLYF